MDMLSAANRAELFPAERPVRTKTHEDVSTYYAEGSAAKNCLVADGCIIDGEIDNCIISSDVRIRKGAQLSGCVIMRGTEIGEGVIMKNVIADKSSTVSSFPDDNGQREAAGSAPEGHKDLIRSYLNVHKPNLTRRGTQRDRG